jgi:hypothetical protein
MVETSPSLLVDGWTLVLQKVSSGKVGRLEEFWKDGRTRESVEWLIPEFLMTNQ